MNLNMLREQIERAEQTDATDRLVLDAVRDSLRATYRFLSEGYRYDDFDAFPFFTCSRNDLGDYLVRYKGRPVSVESPPLTAAFAVAGLTLEFGQCILLDPHLLPQFIELAMRDAEEEYRAVEDEIVTLREAVEGGNPDIREDFRALLSIAREQRKLARAQWIQLVVAATISELLIEESDTTEGTRP